MKKTLSSFVFVIHTMRTYMLYICTNYILDESCLYSAIFFRIFEVKLLFVDVF